MVWYEYCVYTQQSTEFTQNVQKKKNYPGSGAHCEQDEARSVKRDCGGSVMLRVTTNTLSSRLLSDSTLEDTDPMRDTKNAGWTPSMKI